MGGRGNRCMLVEVIPVRDPFTPHPHPPPQPPNLHPSSTLCSSVLYVLSSFLRRGSSFLTPPFSSFLLFAPLISSVLFLPPLRPSFLLCSLPSSCSPLLSLSLPIPHAPFPIPTYSPSLFTPSVVINSPTLPSHSLLPSP